MYLRRQPPNRRIRVFTALAAAGLVLITAAPTLAKKKGKKAPTAAGQYTDWNDEIDQLEIVKTFERSGYQKVVVGDFDTSNTPLPDADDNTYEPVKTVLADPESSFLEGLRKAGTKAEQGDGGDGALVIDTRVVEMDPGSRAGRYWGGFGAGAVRVVLNIEIKDGASGETLLKVQQERRSGFGMAGGSYVKLMNRTLRQLGGDVAMILDAF